MGARGRHSAAEISVVQPGGVTAIPRQPPPDVLTDEEAVEWQAVVNRMPADWFPRETHAMLIQYCRHVVTARRVSEMVNSFAPDEDEPGWLESYDRMLKMQEREGRALSALATRMRLSQQSSYTARLSKGAKGATPPHKR
jgi:hypothetical protein